MTDLVYYVLCAVLALGVLLGISLMSKVQQAVKGNLLSAFCMLAAIVLTLIKFEVFASNSLWLVIVGMLAGGVIGIIWTLRAKMIEMPQLVALFNGFGGAASALVALITLLSGNTLTAFSNVTAMLALAVGMITLTGSLVAAGKLHKWINQRPVILRGHQTISYLLVILIIAACVAVVFPLSQGLYMLAYLSCLLFSTVFGVVFSIRVGGADMPVTISLLNSLSGVAGSIAGMAVGDPLLVAIGGIVGASGLLLTQIMCKAMHRSLSDILLGKTSVATGPKTDKAEEDTLQGKPSLPEGNGTSATEDTTGIQALKAAKDVIIVPGYGMALSQAQQRVKQLADQLEAHGATVRYAIHPVAGRMPGHMNVLLAEVDVPYDQLYEMDDINDAFQNCDVAVIIGACDVVNPAARDAEGTPIYGMPILAADQARHVIVCNFDRNPGYAGVPNPLYNQENVSMLLGDAKDSLTVLLDGLRTSAADTAAPEEGPGQAAVLAKAKDVIIVPGYGMALAQAQQKVKQLADRLEAAGVTVRYAIHPVAGRMPGHMNVLLAEVDVPYDQLYEMDAIDAEFATSDLAIIVGACDVVNPAARDAEGTPIYGMPILSADQAKHVIICNYDKEPGYAGVPNPLYDAPHVTMLLGDAKDSLDILLAQLA